MTTQPMEALKPERIELPNDYQMHFLPTGVFIGAEGKNWPLCKLEMDVGVARAFAAAMNTRPATDGLREAVDFKLDALNKNRADIEERIKKDVQAFARHYSIEPTAEYVSGMVVSKIREWLASLKQGTPQAPAAPPVLPSDEDLATDIYKYVTYSHNLRAKRAVPIIAAMIAAHRTAHQNAADDGWRDIDSAPNECDVLLWVGNNKPPIVGGFFNGGWYPYDSQKRIVEPTHWRPLPNPPRNGRGG